MKRLTYANVMASIAVFAALGGSAYAAGMLTGSDIKNGSLTTLDVKNRSLKAVDFKRGQLPKGERGARGARGPRGAKGATGATGSTGATGATARWLLIDESGNIEEQSGGFTVASKPGINGQPGTNPNYYVDAGSSLVGKGLTATIAIQNRLDRTGDMVADPAFGGDTAVGRCNTAAVACAPTGTNVDNVFVVRALTTNTDATSQTRRVYVQITS